jgi:hypothetical protein
MPERGGKREGAGRKKAERPTNAVVAAKVLSQAKAEKLWLELIDLERKRLGLAVKDHKHRMVWKKKWGAYVCSECGFQPDDDRAFSIIPLTNLLRYLEDRAYGRPVDTVNHLHDKPIQHEVTVKMSELIREVRERKQQYERSRS